MSRSRPMTLVDGPLAPYRQYGVATDREGRFEATHATPGRPRFRDVHEYRRVPGTDTATWVRHVRTEPIDMQGRMPT